jgi:hypothetical protein
MSGNVNDIITYKDTIIRHLISTDDILELLLPNLDPNLTPEEQLLGEDGQVFKYDYVPDTSETAKRFVCIEGDISRLDSNTIKDITITIHVFTEKSLMRHNLVGIKGNAVDVLSDRIETFMTTSEDFGIKSNIKSTIRTKPATGYYGRMLIYTISEFKRNR